MPFWKRTPKVNPEVEAAVAEATAALPAGWHIDYADYESFQSPRGNIRTYGVLALGPGGEATLVVGVGEANAHLQLARYLRGEFEQEEGWAPPLPRVERGRPRKFRLNYPDDPDVIAAHREVEAALPPGWTLFACDRERYKYPGDQLEAFGVSAVGPADEAELVVALGESNALRQLRRRLEGELETAEGWAPVPPATGAPPMHPG